ncbi:retinal cone rhodopsin-sensitive cGMP 3,5-cyclic phosphodiesterase subunit gamma-like protein [Camelus ferus]|nr:retinal cone rhodopsin-sensitive cGMP 3,5-cyclic phosphodiesterase subunit gamma-like protein [Camelus ferus]
MSDSTTLAPPASNQGPTTPRKGPPKFKQRQTRQFKSKPPKKGVKGFGDDIPGMEGLGTVEVGDDGAGDVGTNPHSSAQSITVRAEHGTQGENAPLACTAGAKRQRC